MQQLDALKKATVVERLVIASVATCAQQSQASVAHVQHQQQEYVHQLHGRIHTQQLEGEAYMKQLHETAKENLVLEGRLKTVEATAAHFEKRLNDQLRENDDLKAKISAQSQKHAAEVARLKKKVEDLKDADFDSRSKIRRLRLELDEKEKDLKRLSTNSNSAALSSAFVATGECLKRRRNVIKIGHIGPIQKRTSHSVDQTEHVGLADMLIPISPPPVAPPVSASTHSMEDVRTPYASNREMYDENL
ncbi:hypothetical protein AAVH_42935 [Aphelenchoides avenae]|nr:hypothetical protein AAVH_42935 [Aphelenchus avenae]